MSVRFSRVSMKNGEMEASFLVGGEPKAKKDLKGWSAFDSFMNQMPKGERVAAKVETFLYGDAEPYDATPEEVAYMYKRLQLRPDFIEERTEKEREYEISLKAG